MTTIPTAVPIADVITAEIAKRKARYDRMPIHFEAKRIAEMIEMIEIMRLVDQVLELRKVQ